MFKDNDYTLLTPTRFLMDSTTNNDWNFSTASSSFYINESNPFQDQKQQDILTMPPSPETTVTIHPYAPNTPPTPPQQARSPKITKTNERKHLLEKNRQAAYRCRQKKKRWVQELEEKSDFSERKNKELQEQVTQLRDESVYLRNLLLTHGNCQCKVVQDYLKRTSAQLSGQADIGTSYNSNTLFSTSQQHYNL